MAVRKPVPPTEDQIQAFAQTERRYKLFRWFARDFWRYACPDAPHPAWVPHMDIVCNEIQAVVEESDRRRALQTAILAECGEDMERATRLQAAAFVGLFPLRLVILVPPRGSKSKLTECLFPAWRWAGRRMRSSPCRRANPSSRSTACSCAT